MKHIPVHSISTKDKIRIRAKGLASVMPVMDTFYIDKIELAPDGAKVIWVTLKTPTDSY
jgi:hypothetical protein